MAKYDPDWEAKAAAAKKARAPMRAAKRKATQAQRKTTRSPGGWQAGGATPLPPGLHYDPDWRVKKRRKQGSSAIATRKKSQAKRKASRSPGGWAGGGSIESYNDQVKRKYGGGKL